MKVIQAGDDAKTSEYAFYKKLKKDAGHKVGFHPLNYDANRIQAKNLKSGSYSKGELIG